MEAVKLFLLANRTAAICAVAGFALGAILL